MSNYRKRMAVQRTKKNEAGQQDSIIDPRPRIDELRRRIRMYRSAMDAFEEGSEERKLCENDIFDIVSEISNLEQKGGVRA